MKDKYDATFPILDKIDVNGNGSDELYKYLKSNNKDFQIEDIAWNFSKFLVD